jgi:solute carrier family 25 protein 39/40
MTTPFDVVKTRLQVSSQKGNAKKGIMGNNVIYSTHHNYVCAILERRMLQSIKQIFRTEGVRGLFRGKVLLINVFLHYIFSDNRTICLGCIPRVAKIAPSCAIMISSYELGKMFFARKRAGELAPQQSVPTH